jgi:hypothetical protein
MEGIENKMRIDRLPFKANYFWSYKKDADLPLGVLAEKVLIYGDFEDIFSFQKMVGTEIMVKVWNEKIQKNPRYERLNVVLEIMYGNSEFNEKYASTNLESLRGAGCL